MGASERDEEERAAWGAQASHHAAEELVFVDECGSNLALTPLDARAPKGERARRSAPRNRGKNTTLIASLSLDGMGAAMILEGSANATAFALYVEQVLAPTLRAGETSGHGPLTGPQRRAGEAGHRGERVWGALLAWLFARLFPD